MANRSPALTGLWSRLARHFANGGLNDGSPNNPHDPTDVIASGFIPGYGTKDSGILGEYESGVQTAIDPGGIFKKPAYNPFVAQAYGNAYQPQGMSDYQGQMAQGFGQSNDVNAQQSGYADMLRNQIAGQGPSLAQGQLRGATDRINSQAAGMAASQRGVSPAMAMRQAMLAQASNNQSAAGQSGLIRSQEQLNAQSLLGGALQGQRQAALAQAQLGSQGNLGLQQLEQRTGAENANNLMQREAINAQISAGNAGAEQKGQGGMQNSAGSGLQFAHGGVAHLAAGGAPGMGGTMAMPAGSNAPAGQALGVSDPNSMPMMQAVLMGILKGIIGKYIGGGKGGEKESGEKMWSQTDAPESLPSELSAGKLEPSEAVASKAPKSLEAPKLGASMYKQPSAIMPSELSQPSMQGAPREMSAYEQAMQQLSPLDTAPWTGRSPAPTGQYRGAERLPMMADGGVAGDASYNDARELFKNRQTQRPMTADDYQHDAMNATNSRMVSKGSDDSDERINHDIMMYLKARHPEALNNHQLERLKELNNIAGHARMTGGRPQQFADGGLPLDTGAELVGGSATPQISSPKKSGGMMDTIGQILPIVAMFLDHGGEVPGHAKYPGNDIRNDVVPAVLSKEEVVLPRNVTLSQNPPAAAADFMRQIMAQHGAKPDYAHVLRKNQALENELSTLRASFGRRS